MNGNNDAFPLPFLGENVMTAVDALQHRILAVFLDDADKFFAGNLFHLPYPESQINRIFGRIIFP